MDPQEEAEFDPVTRSKWPYLQCEGCNNFCTLWCTKCGDEKSLPCSNICSGCTTAYVIIEID